MPSKSQCKTASLKIWDNDSAQIAVIVFFFLAMVFIAFYWILLGGMMDKVTIVHNNLTTGANATLPISAERQTTLSILQSTFAASPIFAFVLGIVAALIAGLANRYSVV